MKYRILTVPTVFGVSGIYRLEVKFIIWFYIGSFFTEEGEDVRDAAKRLVLKRRKKPQVVGEFKL